MISRERKIRPAITSGWFESDIAINLENCGDLSRRTKLNHAWTQMKIYAKTFTTFPGFNVGNSARTFGMSRLVSARRFDGARKATMRF
jgi:hypothetical protein